VTLPGVATITQGNYFGKKSAESFVNTCGGVISGEGGGELQSAYRGPSSVCSRGEANTSGKHRRKGGFAIELQKLSHFLHLLRENLASSVILSPLSAASTATTVAAENARESSREIIYSHDLRL
jgi:hypothetical protein